MSGRASRSGAKNSIFPGRVVTSMQEQIFRDEGRPWTPDLLVYPRDIANLVAAAVDLTAGAEISEVVIRPACKF